MQKKNKSEYFFEAYGDFYAYHVVTDKPMQVGQHITFDDTHKSGVYQRVMARQNAVKAIYRTPNAYVNEPIEHHLMVAMREAALEKVRCKRYEHYPSRLACLYVSERLEEADSWAAFFKSIGRDVLGIVKVKVRGSVFIADANNCFDAVPDEAKNLIKAEQYWSNQTNRENKKRINEVLVNGDIEVVEIIK